MPRAAFMFAAVLPFVPTGHVSGQGEERDLRLELEVPDGVAVGDRCEALATVRLGRALRSPLLVTPEVEGGAIEVARGRLHSTEATEEDGVLRFRIPLIARRRGSSILRVRVDGFVCDREHCLARSVRAASTLEVRLLASSSDLAHVEVR